MTAPGSSGPPRRHWTTWPLVAGIYAYRFTLGPLLGGQCRFYPTCSQYALDALQEHGPIRGTWLTVRRLCRCHPLGGSGPDPVPTKSRTARSITEADRGDSGA